MFRFETRIVFTVMLMILLMISLYIIASDSTEYKALQNNAKNLKSEVADLKMQLHLATQSSMIDKTSTTENGRISIETESSIIGHKTPGDESASMNIFVETNNSDLAGRQFYKIPGKSSSYELYELVSRLPHYQKKRILITGGAGFVGSHLVDSLMLDGHDVIVCDNFLTGRRSNVEHWLGHQNFRLLEHDVTEPLTVMVDEIYHLASPASPVHYMANSIKTIKTNTLGTINMLELAKTSKAKIVIASSSEIYGDPEIHPQTETYWGNTNPVGPRSCYDESKRLSETLSVAYNQRENVSTRIARIFNTYGPRMHPNDGRVVSNFIIQSISNQSITVYGLGKQTRSFQYITDLVSGLKLLMASNVTSPVNMGNPNEMTIHSLASHIRSFIPDSTSDITYKDLPVDDPHRRKPDITKANNLLGWQPVVPLSYGLKRTIDYFRQEIKLN